MKPQGVTQTFEGHVTERAAAWATWITIEGLGTAEGLYRWACRSVPSFARGGALWLPLVSHLPSPSSQRASPDGGVSEAGELAAAVLDQNDVLTAALKLDSRPVTALAVAAARTDRELDLLSTTRITEGSAIWVGGECVIVRDITGTRVLCDRGALDTVPLTHPRSTLVFAAMPAAEGRKVRLFYGAAHGRTGIPWPALNAREFLDDARDDLLSLRCDEASGLPQDSSRAGRHATAVNAISYDVAGAVGPRWKSLGLDGSSSRVELDKFQPGNSVTLLAAVFWDVFTGTRAIASFVQHVSPTHLLTLWSPSTVYDVELQVGGEVIGFNFASNPATGEWHLFEVQLRPLAGGTTEVRFVFDGALVHTSSVPLLLEDLDFTAEDGLFHLGCTWSGGGGGSRTNFFPGRLGGVRLINATQGEHAGAERWRRFSAETPAAVEWATYRWADYEMDELANEYSMTALDDPLGVGSLVCGRRPTDGFELEQLADTMETFATVHAAAPSSPALWGDRVYVRVGRKEIIECEVLGSTGVGLQLKSTRRGVAGTTPKSFARGDAGAIVYVADPTAVGAAFRYSPGPELGGGVPSESRSSGTWTVTAHFIPLILTLATSSAEPDDGLELVNYDPTYGNFATLPPGVGVGIAAHEIEWESFVEVWRRTPGWAFEAFAVGADDEEQTFGDLITKHFLLPIGAFLSTHRGKAVIVLPRLPHFGQELLTLGPATVVRRIVGSRAVMQMTKRRANNRAASMVIYKARRRSGAEATVKVNDALVRSLQGQRNGRSPFRPREIPAESVLVDSQGSSPFLERVGAKWLAGNRTAGDEIKARALWDLEPARIGEFVYIEHPGWPDHETGRRGVTGMIARVEERRPVASPGEPPSLEMKLRGFSASLKVGVIGPSALVVGEVEEDDGEYIVTVAANFVTEADGPTDLPRTDSQAFALGDVLILCERSGGRVGSETATVVAAPDTDGANTLRLDGTFDDAIADGRVLSHAGRDEAVAQQYNRFVNAADEADRDIGASDDPPWQYGEE